MNVNIDEKKDSFCNIPFENFEIMWTGDVYLCCSAWVPVPVGNLNNNTVMNIWNSDIAIKIRESILDGTYSFCNKDLCAFLQTDTLPRKDNIKDPYFNDIVERGLTQLEKGPRILTLCNDRTCNLWCPSCRTSKFVLSGTGFEKSRLQQKKLLAEGLKDARLLVLSGSGDPFASSLHMELLTTLRSVQYPDLKIKIMTNGLLLTPQNWARLDGIKDSIRYLIVSIDAATAETYIKIRRGGDFRRLMENLNFVSQLRKDGKLDRVEFHFVVQQGNYKEMIQFIELGKSFGVDMVSFARLCNYGSFAKDEYLSRAIHLEGHPECCRFIQMISEPMFKDPIVNMSNLTDFLSS